MFVASLYMMCNVLLKVSRLSLIFQISNTTTVDALKLPVHTDAEYLANLDLDISTSLASNGVANWGSGANSKEVSGNSRLGQCEILSRPLQL